MARSNFSQFAKEKFVLRQAQQYGMEQNYVNRKQQIWK
jgi:hypothetical protein